MAGSAGVLIPPKGYLQRLRAICDKHGILLIFDEVITGFGRLGTPFGADYFGVTPDIMTTAKGVTNGVVPMGAVFVQKEIYEAFMNGPGAPGGVLPRLHLFRQPGLDRGGARHARHLPARGPAHARRRSRRNTGRTRCFSLKGLPHVIDIRRIGLVGAVELEPIAGEPAKRAFAAFVDAYEAGITIRTTGDIIAMSPPLIIEKSEIDFLIGKLSEVLKRLN